MVPASQFAPERSEVTVGAVFVLRPELILAGEPPDVCEGREGSPERMSRIDFFAAREIFGGD
jgi:hypothetical protein